MSIALSEYLFAKDFTPAARRWYASKLSTFVRWCQEQQADELGALTATTIRHFLAHLRSSPSPRSGTPPTGQTIHGYARALKCFLNWCVRDELLDERVVRRVEMPKVEQKVIATLSPTQVKALFAACEAEADRWLAERDKAILAVLLDTGIRAHELCGLTLERVVLTPDDPHLLVDGKGRKQREIGLGMQSRHLLHRYLHRYRPAARHTTHAFLGRRHEPLTPEGLGRMFARLRKRVPADGVRISAHTFRHTYACAYLASGGDVYKLSRLLGHTSITITERYLRAFSARAARQGVSVFDTLAKLA